MGLLMIQVTSPAVLQDMCGLPQAQDMSGSQLCGLLMQCMDRMKKDVADELLG